MISGWVTFQLAKRVKSQLALTLAAWKRLRKLVDCSDVEIKEISVKYGKQVKEAAQRHFTNLVPARNGSDLYTHLFRSVYIRIATHWFAPPSINDLTYCSTIAGHYWVANEEDPEKKHNYEATLHYYDYRIGDGHGNIDGRQGIKLAEPGVKVLDVFQPKEETAAAAGKKGKGKRKMSTGQLVPVEQASQTGRSMLSPKQETQRIIVNQIGPEVGAESHDDVLRAMINSFYSFKQVCELLAPFSEGGLVDPVEALQELINDQIHLADKEQKEHLAVRWKTSLEDIEALFAEVEAVDEEKPVVEYLKDLLQQKKVHKASLNKRISGVDFSGLPYSQLKPIKSPDAVIERLNRGVNTIMAYNRLVAHLPEMRWYINAAVMKDLVGGRHDQIQEYLKSRSADIDQHHEEYKLTPATNRKPVPITARVQIPEDPRSIPTNGIYQYEADREQARQQLQVAIPPLQVVKQDGAAE